MARKVNGPLIISEEYKQKYYVTADVSVFDQLSADKTPCVPGYLRAEYIPLYFSLFRIWVFVFLFHRDASEKGWAQQFSAAGGDNRVRYHTTHSKLVLYCI